MLKQFLSRLEPVHRAETREEREAVYRFRYQVYVEEFGRELGTPDHERGWVTDADDEKDSTTLLYTGSIEQVTGTVRLRHWRPGQVPDKDLRELSMDRFEDIEDRGTAEIERLMVRKTMRGKVVIASLLRASYEILVGEHDVDLTFCYCSPGLVSYYQQLAMRPFGGRLVHAPDGMMVPLVAVMSDHAYYKRRRSFLAPLVRKHFGRGRRAPLDLAPYAHLFAPGATGIEFEPERVWGQVEATLGRGSSFFDALPRESVRRLVSRAQIVDVEAGTLVTRQGFGERELYVALDGRFAALDGDRVLNEMGDGELFGEIAFFHPRGRRTASVEAKTGGRVLILRGRAVDKLMRKDPALATQLQSRLAGVMAERLAGPATA